MSTVVECPNCHHKFDIQSSVDEIVARQVKEQVLQELRTKEDELKKEYDLQQAQLTQEKQRLAHERTTLQDTLKKKQEELEKQAFEARQNWQKQRETELEQEYRERRKLAEAELSKRLEEEFAEKLAREKKALERQKEELERLEAEKAAAEKARAEAQRSLREAQEQQQAREQELQREAEAKLKKALEEKQNQLSEELQAAFEEKLARERKQRDEKNAELEKMLAEKEAADKERREAKRALMELRAQQEEKELEMKRQLQESVEAERKRVEQMVQERFQMELAEKDRKNQQLAEQLAEAHRKAQLGSQQAQGEVQELFIEDYLKQAFPIDQVEEVKKGQRGADCIWRVCGPMGTPVATVVVESKRTKDFQNTWIPKLIENGQAARADALMLVTEVLPKDVRNFALLEDRIWVCDLAAFRALAPLLRQQLLQLGQLKQSQQNKGEKMGQLYDYLIGSEFGGQMRNILESYNAQRDQIDKERKLMMASWKSREKQLERVIESVSSIQGSIMGISGNEINILPEYNDEALFLEAGDDNA